MLRKTIITLTKRFRTTCLPPLKIVLRVVDAAQGARLHFPRRLALVVQTEFDLDLR